MTQNEKGPGVKNDPKKLLQKYEKTRIKYGTTLIRSYLPKLKHGPKSHLLLAKPKSL